MATCHYYPIKKVIADIVYLFIFGRCSFFLESSLVQGENWTFHKNVSLETKHYSGHRHLFENVFKEHPL
jgi:hypothetical protein